MPPVPANTETEKTGAATKKKAEPVTLALPSGKTATVAPGYGYHIAQAAALAPTPDLGEFALVALLAKVDGAALTVADVEDMPLADAAMLIQRVTDTAPAGEVPKDAYAHDGGKLIPLPSGAWAEVRTGKGRDLIKAQRQATKQADVNMALVAVLSRYNGAPVVVEDVQHMPIGDVLAMQAVALGN